MQSDGSVSFQARLDATHQWPCLFMFKFIMRPYLLSDFKKIFPEEPWRNRSSSGGKYVCVTMERWVNSSEEVLDIYKRASVIEGIFLL